MNENVWIAFIVCVCLIVCILIVVLYFRSRNMHKERLLKHSQQHEINMVKEEFNNKKEWEEIINTHLKENKATKEELEESKKDIFNKVVEKLNKPSQIDLNKVAMIHLLLSGNMEPITAENLDAEIKKVEKTYQLLKDKVS